MSIAAQALLNTLEQQGIQVRVKGDKLRLVPRSGEVPASLVETVRRHKPALLKLLPADTGPPPLSMRTQGNRTNASALTYNKRQITDAPPVEKNAAGFPEDSILALYPADPPQLLAFIRSVGVTLFEKPGARLGYLLPESAMPEPELRALLKVHWYPILLLLQSEEPIMPLTEEDKKSIRYVENWNASEDRQAREEKERRLQPARAEREKAGLEL